MPPPPPSAFPPVRALTLGVAAPHPLPERALAEAAAQLRDVSAAFTGAGWQVQTERLSTRPVLADLHEWPDASIVAYAKDLQAALESCGVPWCSLGPALPHHGPGRALLMAELLAGNPALNASVLVASPDAGLRPEMAGAAAEVMLRLANARPDGLGNFNFAALACVAPGAPFLPAAYHLPGKAASLSIALQGAGVVAEALTGGVGLAEVPARVSEHLERRARPSVEIASQAATALGLAFEGIDLSPAPDGDDSIAGAMELAGSSHFAGGAFGGPGTLALAAAITAGVQRTTLPTCGYCGLMLPLMEDTVLARRWEEGRFGIADLLSYSAVCGTGLDTVPVPGNSSPGALAALICDVASLALRHRKPLSARLLPAPGKTAGEQTVFSSPYLVNTVIKPLVNLGL